jgi:schlafen family protein
MDDAIPEKIANAAGETANLDFKSAFDPTSNGDWCGSVEDIVAFANSGGGCIAFGAKNDGSPAKADLAAIRKVDLAIVVDKVQKYTDQHFANFSFGPATRQGGDVVAPVIQGTAAPTHAPATAVAAPATDLRRRLRLLPAARQQPLTLVRPGEDDRAKPRPSPSMLDPALLPIP